MKKTVVKPKHDDNYDISEMNSDDSTDDEEAPRKIVPKWAIGERNDEIKYYNDLTWLKLIIVGRLDIFCQSGRPNPF